MPDDLVYVRDGADRQDCFVLHSGDGRDKRFGSRAEHQLVIGIGRLGPIGDDRDQFALGIDTGHLALGMDIDAEHVPERLDRGDQQVLPVLDDPSGIVRQSAIGKTHIRALLKQDDGSLFVTPPDPGGDTCSSGHSTDNDIGLLAHPRSSLRAEIMDSM